MSNKTAFRASQLAWMSARIQYRIVRLISILPAMVQRSGNEELWYSQTEKGSFYSTWTNPRTQSITPVARYCQGPV